MGLAYVGTNGLASFPGLFAAAAARAVRAAHLPARHDELHDLLGPLGDVLVVAEGGLAAALEARRPGPRTPEFVALR